MFNDRIIWFGRYEGWLRLLAKGVKAGDAQCWEKAARLFDLMLPNRCVVVPMPSHDGTPGYMSSVSAALPGNRYVAHALRCDPHESSYDIKKSGGIPRPFNAWFNKTCLRRAPEEDRKGGIYVIDNVICTGITAGAALLAVKLATGREAIVCTLAYSTWR